MRSLRPRRLPAARRRSQLIEVALDLFGAGGFHATSMDDIAERAGVTKPVVYQHFPSKAHLYLELIETVGDELLRSVTVAATAQPLPYQRVLAGFQAYFRFVERRTSAFRLLFGGAAREEDGVAETVQRVETSIAGTIAELIDVDLDQQHRDLLGFAIVGLAEVSSRQWLRRAEEAGVRPDPDEGDLLAHRLADLVWAGLRGLPSHAQPEASGAPPSGPPARDRRP